MTTFKVGDKVRYGFEGTGVLTYGPYQALMQDDAFLMRRDSDGRERIMSSASLTALPTFAVGDMAKVGDTLGEIVAGPFTGVYSDSNPVYVLKQANGRHLFPNESTLRKVEATPATTGDRVRVLVDDVRSRTGEFVGKIGTVTRVNAGGTLPYRLSFDASEATPYTSWWVAKVEKVTSEPCAHSYEGVSYELGARYRDKDGDTWRFSSVEGIVRGGAYDDLASRYSPLISTVVDDYGPLRKL